VFREQLLDPNFGTLAVFCKLCLKRFAYIDYHLGVRGQNDDVRSGQLVAEDVSNPQLIDEFYGFKREVLLFILFANTNDRGIY
jgi:hypothetical protein